MRRQSWLRELMACVYCNWNSVNSRLEIHIVSQAGSEDGSHSLMDSGVLIMVVGSMSSRIVAQPGM